MKTEDSTDTSEFTVVELHIPISLALRPMSEYNDSPDLFCPFTVYETYVSKLNL